MDLIHILRAALHELLEDQHALRQALPPMQLHHRTARLQAIEGLVKEAHLFAGGHEDDDLLLRVASSLVFIGG